ncbi:hypothetical protein L1987_66515 [Smallanthus sonchifolius]|uniref:Uncharacterized protein n=1 Tax=Smallanthus sonchifolius TaxID=185202 RepID=A0ACB9BXP9_9ASTR|nr:hypothetical protein L1987_66515 [Smallanthus sonchifolius]
MFPPKNKQAVEKARRSLPENVIVAVKAEEKVVSKEALAWALTHVVHPGDCVMLLAVISSAKSSKTCLFCASITILFTLMSNCGRHASLVIKSVDMSDLRMLFTDGPPISKSVRGNGANQGGVRSKGWKLKQELKHCMEELHCNIVVMKGSEPKVLKLNLARPDELQTPFFSAVSSPTTDPEKLLGHGVNHSTPVSSPEETSVFHPQVSNKNLLSNSVASSVFLVYKQNPLFETLIKGKPSQINEPENYDNTAMDSCGERIITLSLIPNSSATIPQNNTVDDHSNIYQNSQFSYKKEKIFSSGIREAVSLGRALSLPPPLCSLCQYQAPALGPMEMLISAKRTYLDWPSRLKIAVGTATGLRYLHEDCRVGCIVHRDMRPKNILLTHDYEPLVADFGLVSLHSDHDACYEERVIGTSGYLAPEYFNGGIVTEKVDIYAFGLVLLELITGRRTSELQSYKTQKFWHDVYTSKEMEPVHLLAYKHNLLDPRLGSYQPYSFPPDLHAIGYAASLCLQKDPESRPPMSKVLKVLEGETRNYLGVDMHSSGSRSGHMRNVILNAQIERMGHSRRLSY